MLNNLLANAGDIRDASLIPGSGRSPGEGHGNPLQYSCLEIPMDTGDWRLQSIASHGVGHDWRNEAPTHARTQQWECRCPFKTQISCPLGIYSEELQKSDSIPRIDLYGQAMPLISDSILFLNSASTNASWWEVLLSGVPFTYLVQWNFSRSTAEGIWRSPTAGSCMVLSRTHRKCGRNCLSSWM